MARIFRDENESCEFDFTKAEWATDQLHAIYHQAKIDLSDVDYMVETERELLFIEYKNASVRNAEHPERFHIKSDKKLNTLVRKYYDSLHYVQLLRKGEGKRKVYICVLEYPNSESVSRRYIRNRLADKLPFALQQQVSGGIRLIDEVKVLSLEEWNQQYSNFPVSRLE